MRKFASNFVGKSPLARLKSEQDSIKPITQEMKDAAKLGGAGAIGMIGGAAGGAVKGTGKAVKALGKNDAKAGITVSNPNPTGIRGTGKSRTGKGKVHPLITGGRSLRGMKSYGGR